MRLALGTSHMVAASVLLDQYLAFRALLNILITLGPTFQQPRLRILVCLPLLAAEPVMVLPTGHTNGDEARSAPENTISRIRLEGVDFGAVRSGAVPELVRMATKMFKKGDFQKVLEFGRDEEPLYDWEGDRETTLPFVTQT